jgi:hypothetical protein
MWLPSSATLLRKLRLVRRDFVRNLCKQGEIERMSTHAQADLILKLYDLRREATMRVARDYFGMEFNPQSMDDIMKTFYGPHSGHVRMVISYWDMAAALVNHGAIDLSMFNDTNGEHFAVFSKMEPFLAELRAAAGPQFLRNLEKLIDSTPDGRKRVAEYRERMKAIRASMAQSQTK